MRNEEIRAKWNDGNPQVEVTVVDNLSTKYIHVAEAEGMHYTVSSTSIFDYMVGVVNDIDSIEFEEEYSSVAKAKDSAYIDSIRLADKIYKGM